MKKTLNSSLILFLAASFVLNISCERVDSDKPKSVTLDRLSGLVQKGPYMNGTSVDVAELTSDLIQTGKNFNTQISNNRGSFEIKQLELSSQFVELKADGFYYNEITGSPSEARLIL